MISVPRDNERTFTHIHTVKEKPYLGYYIRGKILLFRMGLSCEYSVGKWELSAKEQGGKSLRGNIRNRGESASINLTGLFAADGPG